MDWGLILIGAGLLVLAIALLELGFAWWVDRAHIKHLRRGDAVPTTRKRKRRCN